MLVGVEGWSPRDVVGSRGKHLADAAHSMPGDWKPSCQPGAGSARLALSGWNGECKEVVVAFSPSSVAALPSSSPQEGAALSREEQGAVASAAKELTWALGAKKRSVVKAFLKKGKQRLAASVKAEKWVSVWVQVVQTQLKDSCILAGRDVKHIRAPFACLADSTLSRHVAGWNRWAAFCKDQGHNPGTFEPVLLADFCSLLGVEDPEQCGVEGACSGSSVVRSSLKALSFVARRTQAGSIIAALDDPSVRGYLKESEPTTERKEAAPFPLVAVVALERVFYMGNVPLGYQLLAGFFLACIWGSLRFSDAARTSPRSLSVEGWILRGTAWKTKVCSRGTPFGVIGAGLLGNFPEWGWVHKWLCALSRWISMVPLAEREKIDFLLPHFAMDGSSVSSEPMSYTTAVLRLRHMLGWKGNGHLVGQAT